MVSGLLFSILHPEGISIGIVHIYIALIFLLGIEFFGKSRDSNVSREFANTTDDRLLLVNQIALMNDTNGMN